MSRRIVRERGEAIHADTLFHTNLRLLQYRDGRLIDERDLGPGTITTAGATLMAADWNNATATLKLTNWHDSGTGTAPAGVADVALQTPTGGARIAGSQATILNSYQSVARLAYTSGITISEWGIWTAVTGGTLWDRRVFVGQPVINADILEWIYQLTVVPGG